MNAERPGEGGTDGRAERQGKPTEREEQTGGPGPGFGICDRRAATMKLSKGARQLYMLMSTYADGKSRVARPGQDRLATELGWTYSGGKPDRRGRLSKALAELEDADLIRRHGTYPLGQGKWVRCYLVAPFPNDAETVSASLRDHRTDDADQRSASAQGSRPNDADIPAPTMRTFPADDADTATAPSDQLPSNQSSSERCERDEQQELDEIAVRLSMLTASDDELRAARDREAARAS